MILYIISLCLAVSFYMILCINSIILFLMWVSSDIMRMHSIMILDYSLCVTEIPDVTIDYHLSAERSANSQSGYILFISPLERQHREWICHGTPPAALLASHTKDPFPVYPC